MKKKLLSLLLTLSLVLGCMPPAALAAEPEAPDESGSVVEDAAENEDEALPPEEELPAAEGEETPAPADDESPAVDGPEQASDTEAPSDGEAELMASTTMSGVWGGVTWSLTPAGTLTISAAPGVADSGVMPDGVGPWKESLTNTTGLLEVIIQEGVTNIGTYTFCNNWPEDQAVNGCLTTVSLPNSLTSIGHHAFYTNINGTRTSALSSITLPPNLESIGEKAFAGCMKLACPITIPGSCKTVGREAFMNAAITGLTLSEGIETIGYKAFDGCASLTSVTLPSSIWSVGDGAFARCGAQTVQINSIRGVEFGSQTFKECKKLTKVIILPDSITEIPDNMFEKCSSLKDVTLPEGIKSIGYSAFSECALEAIKLPDSLETLENGAFWNCGSLKSITIPNKVRKIGGYTFYGCPALKTVVLGEQVLSIDSDAFGNSSPENITVYYNLMSVDSYNFSDSSLSPMNVTFYGTQAEWDKLCSRSSDNNRLTSATPTIIPITHATPVWDSGSETVSGIWGGVVWSLTVNGTLTISAVPNVVNSGVMPDKERPWVEWLTNGVKLYEVIIQEGVFNIGNETFINNLYDDQAVNGYLDTVVLPNSLTSIGSDAFRSNTGIARSSSLKSITLPPHLESIGERAFAGCEKLACPITIPGSCKAVGGGTFNGAAITGLTLSEGVETIGYNAFNGCGSLTSVTLPSSIKSVGEGAFAYCGAQTVQINSIKDAAFGPQTFKCCEKLTTVIIAPNGITEIPKHMFEKCKLLENVTLPEGIKSIGYCAFSECALKEIRLPDSLETLENGVFWNCGSLKAITIPNKVRKIGGYTFYNCSALETVVLGEQVLSIDSNAFNSSPENITIYYNLGSVDGYNFQNGSIMNVTFYGTQEEWNELCGRSSNNACLTTANPTIIPITHTTLTWSDETINSVAEAAVSQASLELTVDRPIVEGITEETLVTAMAAAYDGAGRMLGYFSCEVDGSGGVMNIRLPANAVYIKLMMVNGDNTAPLLPAKSIT